MRDLILRYQDVYPSGPLLRSMDVVRPRAADLLTLEFFEAEPAGMPEGVFAQHHLLLNLREEPHRVENWRDGKHRDFTYRLHEIVLTPSGMRSGWYWHAQSRVIVITIEPDKLHRFARAELSQMLSQRQLKDVPQALDEDLCNAGRMLMEALRSAGPASDVMYESLARVFVVKLLERYGERQESPVPDGGLSALQHRRVMDFVERRYGGVIAIEDLAREAGMSPAHFSRRFRQVMGSSPYQFVMDYRVEQARKKLADRDQPLIDVALSCGFADQPHFTRVFKQITGQTPREYRASLTAVTTEGSDSGTD